MKKKNQPGTILVLFLVFCVAVMVIAVVVLKSGATMLEIVHNRIRSMEQIRATQALVYYGIAYATQKGNHNKAFSTIIKSWPPLERNFQGSVKGEAGTKGYHITGILMQEGHEQCVMQATIEQKRGCWSIVHWKEG